jgi:alpha-beta hydrolase superfamily lysophospholipase
MGDWELGIKNKEEPTMNEGSFVGVGGLKIFTRTWNPEGDPRAVIVLVHGFNAHSGYFQWAAKQFAAQGLAVYALDWPGRGRSEGERYYINALADVVADIDTLVDQAQAQHPGLPVFLLGHSAGGVASCIYTLEHQDKLAGLICESFAFELPAPDFAIAVLKGLSHIAPHLHTIKLNNADFSRDEAVVAAMNSDPLIADEAQPASTAAELARADDRLRREFPLITLPLLVLHGTDDKATKPSGSQHFYEQAGSQDKTLKLYEGHFHDLLNDLDKEVVMADIEQWIDKHIVTSAPHSVTVSA